MQINYKECLNEWQDSVTNALTMRAIYDKVPFQSRGHSLKVKDEHNMQRLQLCVNNMTEEYQELIEEGYTPDQAADLVHIHFNN